MRCWTGHELGRQTIEEDPNYLAYCEEQEARGDLAGVPDTAPCYECGGFRGDEAAVERRIVKLGPVVFPSDPTQSYVLECGHTVI